MISNLSSFAKPKLILKPLFPYLRYVPLLVTHKTRDQHPPLVLNYHSGFHVKQLVKS